MTDLISDLPIDDRPRERLLTHGPETLSDAELIAILLGSGVHGKNAIQLARELLCDGLSALRRREPAALSKANGIGPAKASRVIAAFEIARRLTVAEAEDQPSYDSDAFGRALVTASSHHVQERLGAAFLDSRHRILRQREIYVGTINHAAVSTRDVIRHALEENATAVVLYHNHPSGDPSPSAEDLMFTRKMAESLRLCDIDLADHIVIGANRFYSMRRRGQI
jgi:DNA repair protein RadC